MKKQISKEGTVKKGVRKQAFLKDSLSDIRNDRKKLTILVFYMIFGLLLLLFLISGMHRKHSSKAAAEGEAYITAEAAKDPAQVLQAIQAGGTAVADGNQADGQNTGDPASGLQAVTADGSQAVAGEGGISPNQGMTDANQAASEEVENALRAQVQAQMGPLAAQIESLEIPLLSPEQLAYYQQVFANTVVVGDSMAQAVYDYGFLDGNHVYFIRGEAIGNLGGQVDEAMAMLPSSVIFFSGLNGTDYYETPELYAAAYAERINQVLAINPNTKVFVCSMTPPSNELAIYREDLARSPEYDAALQALCASSPAIYMDLNWMVRQQLYLPDGIHFGEEFYTVWMQYAALFLS